MHEYSAQDLKKLFNLPVSLLKSLAADGFIAPDKSGAVSVYSFQDLLVLRTASALRAAKIPARKITQALQKLRDTLPHSNLNALAVAPAGRDIVVREGALQWEYGSGQFALPLAVDPPRSKVTALKSEEAPAPAQKAEHYFADGFELEDTDIRAALKAYETCLKIDPDHVDARINLGRLLHVGGDLNRAEKVYRDGKNPNALLHFNFGVLLEDAGKEPESMIQYRHAIALDPAMADAHFNLARLHENAKQPREALRHLLAYRRLTSAQGE
jgi:tetratricopeptide (TPR) repeat protein